MKINYQDSSVIVFESELMQTTCTLIIRPDHLLLVDPNWLPSEVKFIAHKVEKQRKDLPLYLLFTHSDYDHIIAYERFKATAKLIVSQAFLDNTEQALQLEE
ncbi:MAG: MBL fold metallo-hydrolase, partial [Bacteroidota bacterium]